MRALVVAPVLLLGLAFRPSGAIAQTTAAPATLATRIDGLARNVQPQVVEIRRDIHRHPELGFRETRTAGLVAARLKALGFDEIRTGVGVTGIVAVLKGGKPGPVIAYRADMDALPIQELIDVPYKSTVDGVKHACGHDGHVAIALGVAEVLSRMRADIPGTVVFMFQPAEEGDPDGGETGAVRMLKAGAFENPAPSAIYGLHLMPTLDVGQIGLNVGPAMASSDRFTISIVGKKTHGAYPHTGIDPVPIAAQVVMALQTIPSRQINAHDPTIVTVGIINGGNRFNIVADSVELTGTVRTLSKAGPATVRSKMESIVKGITASFGATYSLKYEEGAPVTFNDPGLSRLAAPLLEAVAGADKVVAPPPQMGAEDFAYFQQRVPGVFYFVGVRNEAKGITAMVHTEYYDMDEDALLLGVRSMSTLLLDHLMRAQPGTGM
jgi:amidohydrolase